MSNALTLMSQVWGEDQAYVCISLRDPEQKAGEPGYWKDLILEWPNDKPKLKKILDKAKESRKDIYWAPLTFDKPRRSKDHVKSTKWLYADLDEADPREFPEELSPSAWWESSPGRFQAIWHLDREVSPSQQSKLNKHLSYALGADKGGWDLTQVLRVPGTPNHKYENVRVSKPRMNGAHPISASSLTKLEAGGGEDLSESPIPASDLLPPDLILKQRKISARAKQLLKARPSNAVEGQRSERLWELECLLAEAGLTVAEIVSLTKGCVWNKFEGRHDEETRLATEARKAILHAAPRKPEPKDRRDDSSGVSVIDDDPEARPQLWHEFDRDHKPIKWLVSEVWGEAEVGFISGTPKSYKSWLSLDMAVSVATGTKFLGSFKAETKRVLLIQEEDPKVVTQDRLLKIAGAKGLVGAEITGPNSIDMVYDLPDNLFIMSGEGFQITDEDWLENLKEWIDELKVDLVILDPLMMMAEGLDEFKAFDMMTKALKPLKRVRAETDAAICVVHHHGKSKEATGASAMYGSVALWAWEESALHLQILSPGKILAERFSKHSKLNPITIEVGDIEVNGWDPQVYSGGSGGKSDLYDLISTAPAGLQLEELQDTTGLSRDVLQKQLADLVQQGKLVEDSAPPIPGQRGRRRKVWKAAD